MNSSSVNIANPIPSGNIPSDSCSAKYGAAVCGAHTVPTVGGDPGLRPGTPVHGPGARTCGADSCPTKYGAAVCGAHTVTANIPSGNCKCSKCGIYANSKCPLSRSVFITDPRWNPYFDFLDISILPTSDENEKDKTLSIIIPHVKSISNGMNCLRDIIELKHDNQLSWEQIACHHNWELLPEQSCVINCPSHSILNHSQ